MRQAKYRLTGKQEVEEERLKHAKAVKLAERNEMKAGVENYVLRTFCKKSTHPYALEAYKESLTGVSRVSVSLVLGCFEFELLCAFISYVTPKMGRHELLLS